MSHDVFSATCRTIVLIAWASIAMAPGIRMAAQAPGVQAVYWCPMHPEIRGIAGEKCPRCGMALVAAAASHYEAYGLDIEIDPAVLRPGQKGRVRFAVRDPRTQLLVRDFELVHERLFHLFVVSRDLEYFAHIHPELRPDGSLDVDLQLPRAGVYQMIADFLPVGGSPQLVQKSFVTAGYKGPLLDVPALAPDTADKIVRGTRVKAIVAEPVAGREQLITVEFEDATTGAPVTDLEPYLGAAGHLLLASADLAIVAHSHPVVELSSTGGGPRVVFQLLFPRAGAYRFWVQFQRRGEVMTASFTVPVQPRH
jgi:hypothetical protein